MKPRPLARGPPLRCGVCGSRRVIAVLPGSEPLYAPGGILIAREVTQLAWCRACWPVARELSTPDREGINAC